jgi:hypothetical protein
MDDARTPMERLRGIEVNPLILAPVVLVVLLALLYFFWLRPKMITDEVLRNYNTPEAQAKRDPDNRRHTPEQQRKIEELRAKEGQYSQSATHRRRHGD